MHLWDKHLFSHHLWPGYLAGCFCGEDFATARVVHLWTFYPNILWGLNSLFGYGFVFKCGVPQTVLRNWDGEPLIWPNISRKDLQLLHEFAWICVGNFLRWDQWLTYYFMYWTSIHTSSLQSNVFLCGVNFMSRILGLGPFPTKKIDKGQSSLCWFHPIIYPTPGALCKFSWTREIPKCSHLCVDWSRFSMPFFVFFVWRNPSNLSFFSRGPLILQIEVGPVGAMKILLAEFPEQVEE